MNYKESIEYINSGEWFDRKPGFERISVLLDKLGNPQSGLKFVHIAGTNGKGSCAAMIASVFKAEKYKTGLFTSPYLYRFNERMQINGKQIDDDVLAGIITEVRAQADTMDIQPTVFELVTACAMLWFEREKCDVVVLEAGLGGKDDATNVIEKPELAVITNIGLDHTAVLGNSVEEIAENKAQIIKPCCACALYNQNEKVESIVRQRCLETGSELRIADFSGIEPMFESLEGQSFTYKGKEYALPLLGAHQRKNAAVVIEAVELLNERGWKISQDALEHGLYSVFWPARFEIISEEPYFVLDGGHNPQCASTVVENLGAYFPGMKHIMLVGVLKDKDYDTLFKIINLTADEYICITPESPRALPAEELCEHLKKYGKPVTVCSEVDDGVFLARDRAEETEGVACAVGSLYMCGKIRECFGLY